VTLWTAKKSRDIGKMFPKTKNFTQKGKISSKKSKNTFRMMENVMWLQKLSLTFKKQIKMAVQVTWSCKNRNALYDRNDTWLYKLKCRKNHVTFEVWCFTNGKTTFKMVFLWNENVTWPRTDLRRMENHVKWWKESRDRQNWKKLKMVVKSGVKQ